MFDARQATGIYTICPTPFDDEGELDLASIHSLVDFQVEAGVKGLAVLGFLGEAHKLTGAERHSVAKTYVEASAGRLPVWVGVRALGLAGAIEQSREAQDLGASAVFAAPLDGANDAQQFNYYQALAKAVDIPVIIHDFPGSFGTEVSTEVVARLGLEGGVNLIKMEEPPVGPKITRIQELAGDSMRIFGGLGGVYLLEELERGAVGTMTGFAFPEILVAIYEHFSAGDVEAAAATFDRYCPLLRYEFQPKLGLALRKYIYQRRGIIGSTYVRAPGMNIDRYTMAEVERTVARVGLSLDVSGPQAII
ncbi:MULTISPECIES: dihydrodipicolinate synthase family protein [unclassified Pseudomonas]|uniref:dihydrodipicolinate synthase family protein n=1 Tax=unclassified Pseudomonas TaxID=196821 RepID=UPI00131CC3B1|nr:MULTISPECIES: dihydrodipicolinate synthase family protein [unclassified Pseudomonas]